MNRFFLVALRGASSLVAVHGHLVAVASFVAGAQALGLASFSSCDLWALKHGLSSRGASAWWHMESSWTEELTHVPCFGRWILNHWTTREDLPTVFCSMVLCVKMYFFFGGDVKFFFNINLFILIGG